ncbi:MAG: NUDIX hydrolase, partial [bacterium]|nr:NUDIX hydrolase [bacterium]
MEKIVVVDKDGGLKKYIEKRACEPGDISAVELTLIYLPSEKKVVLLNRGSGAGDMHSRWALHSGRVNCDDLTADDIIGKEISPEAFKNTAVREFKEELGFNLDPRKLEVIDRFYMGGDGKQLYFALFALPIDHHDFDKLYPDLSEVANVALFSLDE